MAQRTVVRHEVGCLSGALPIRCPIASYSSGAGCATSAYAHAKLVSPCGVNSPSRGTAAAAIASKSAGAVETALVGAIANDQARLERCCSRKLDSRAGASRAIASKSGLAGCRAVANAHAMFATPCGLKSGSRGAASTAMASSRAGAGCLAVA